jgi:hypothetical protein
MTRPRFALTSIDKGSVSAFVVCLALTFVIVAGLAVDSGRLVASRIAVADHAENAARGAVQHVRGLRSGEKSIDPVAARRAASRYLAQFGLVGDILIEPLAVTVTTRFVETMTLLRLVGIESHTVSATRRAALVDG